MLKKTRWLWLLTFAMLPLSSAQASGTREGAAEGHDVLVDRPGLMASGALGTARLEPVSDPDVYSEKAIGCSLDVTATTTQVQCSASNENQGWLGCTSTSKVLASALAAMNGDSKITFYVDPKDGITCLRIIIENNSIFQQKAN